MAARYVIIGNGAAGLSAAETLRALDEGASITIVGDEPHGFYSRPGLAYFLTGELPERQLFSRSDEDYRRQRLTRHVAHAVGLRPSENQVVLDTGEALSYDALLLTTGARAAMPRFPGVDLHGVVVLDNLDNARQIVKLARRARSAVVIGGGVTALELVDGLAARRVRVHYFLRKSRYWANVLDEDESQLVQEDLAENGVRIHFHTEVRRAIGKRNKLVAVETNAGETIKCSVLGIAIGVRPRIRLAQQAGLELDRGVLVNDRLQTSVPNIYAAGDVAQVMDPLTGRADLDVLWSTAIEQGEAAAHNMVGGNVPYVKKVPFNVTRLGGIVTTLIGAVGSPREKDADLVAITRGDSETWRGLANVLMVHDDTRRNRLRLLVRGNNLVGAVVMGNQTLSRPLYELILARADIGPIRQALLAPGSPVVNIITDYWKKLEQQPS